MNAQWTIDGQLIAPSVFRDRQSELVCIQDTEAIQAKKRMTLCPTCSQSARLCRKGIDAAKALRCCSPSGRAALQTGNSSTCQCSVRMYFSHSKHSSRPPARHQKVVSSCCVDELATRKCRSAGTVLTATSASRKKPTPIQLDSFPWQKTCYTGLRR